MALNADTVRKIAFLARIKVPESDLAGLAGELSRIVAWVEELAKVDTEGVQPMASVPGAKLHLRDDAVTDGDRPERVLANAPERIGDYFAVPKVVE